MRAIRTTTISILAIGLLAGSAVGVAAQDEDAADMPTGAESFFGTFAVDWEPTTWGTETIVDGVDQSRGYVNSQGLLETTDPRLTGSVVRASNADAHWVDGRDENVVPWAVVWRIENENGSWTGQGYELQGSGEDSQWDWDDQPHHVTVLMLTGEGDYEGMSAHLTVDWSTISEDFSLVEVRGGVFPGEPPPFPELPATE